MKSSRVGSASYRGYHERLMQQADIRVSKTWSSRFESEGAHQFISDVFPCAASFDAADVLACDVVVIGNIGV